MKKWIALFLVLVFTLSLSVGFAADPTASVWKIEVVDGSAYDWAESETPITTAYAGQQILYGFSTAACPAGKYVSSVTSVPSYLNLRPYGVDLSFEMPAADVKITPVYSAQMAKVVDLRSGAHEMKGDADYAIWYTLLAAAFDFKLCTLDQTNSLDFDLNKDGNLDLRYDGDLYKLSPDKSSITVKTPKAAQYNPLTFVFANPKVSFSANGGSDTMSAVEVKASDFSYTLPACTFTPPAGKVFDKWDKGAPGTKISVTEDTVIKALWKNELIDTTKVSGGIYKLNHKKLTATFVGPVKKTATKLIIKDKVKANGKSYRVTEIKAKACNGMKKLTTVTIGQYVTKIGNSAFVNCKKLKTITIKNAKMKKAGFGASCFKNINAKATFKVPKKVLKNYTTWITKQGKAPKKATIKK